MQLPCMDQLAAFWGVTKSCIFWRNTIPHDLMYVFFFFHRVKLKEGVTFLGARPSNPTQWIVSQDVRSEGHRVVTLHCRRKESSFDQQRSAENSLHCEEKRHFRKIHIVFVVEKVLPTLQNAPNPYPVLIRKMWGEKTLHAHKTHW